MKEKNFYAMLSRMRYINRWGLMRNTLIENISEHSLDVAILAHALAVIRNVCFQGGINAERVAVLALFHDCTEIITGDMPTPVKYYAPEIREAYHEVETAAKNSLLKGLPALFQEIYEPLLLETEEEKELWRLVKAADKLSALIKCMEERKMGNDDFRQAEEATLMAIKEMGIPEVDYFIEEFLPAYFLTLDEQT
ncbi:MAG: 5'-deoxynucleotidase [Lachnospiraceae bacterium]|nr:5'-deoxynucleotidase [Lachnospiraceae bacterium]